MLPGLVHKKASLANGIELQYLQNDIVTGNVGVLFIHGWPSLGFSWRHQLAAMPIKAVAPDLKGFGGSSKPREKEAYSQQTMVSDMLLFISALQWERVVVIGHDWGGVIAWNLALTQDSRIIACGSICTPFYPHMEGDALVRMKESRAFNYQVYFQDGEKAAAELECNVRRTLAAIFRTRGEKMKTTTNKNVTDRGGFLVGTPEYIEPGRLLSDPEVMEYYVRAFQKSGFFANLRLYQNYPENQQYRAETKDVTLQIPCLIITASHDFILKPKHSLGMERLIPNLMRANVEASHWAAEEQPGQVNSHLLAFLREVVGVIGAAKL